jgi:hypothetical protein
MDIWSLIFLEKCVHYIKLLPGDKWN